MMMMTDDDHDDDRPLCVAGDNCRVHGGPVIKGTVLHHCKSCKGCLHSPMCAAYADPDVLSHMWCFKCTDKIVYNKKDQPPEQPQEKRSDKNDRTSDGGQKEKEGGLVKGREKLKKPMVEHIRKSVDYYFKKKKMPVYKANVDNENTGSYLPFDVRVYDSTGEIKEHESGDKESMKESGFLLPDSRFRAEEGYRQEYRCTTFLGVSAKDWATYAYGSCVPLKYYQQLEEQNRGLKGELRASSNGDLRPAVREKVLQFRPTLWRKMKLFQRNDFEKNGVIYKLCMDEIQLTVDEKKESSDELIARALITNMREYRNNKISTIKKYYAGMPGWVVLVY